MYLYHFTSLDVVTKIINCNGLEFHGSRYDSMNDPTDCTYAKNIVMPILRKCVDAKCLEREIEFYPYCVPFSMKESNFMWRLYKGEAALVVDTDEFPTKEWEEEKYLHDTIIHREVKYANEKNIHNIVVELFNNPVLNIHDNPLNSMYINVLPFIKHESYMDEKEYRLIKCDYKTFKIHGNANKQTIENCEVPNGVLVKGVENMNIKLYKKFLLPKKVLTSSMRHPN